MSKSDDAARAVFSALAIQKKLTKFFQIIAEMPEFHPPVHFGISTGNIF